MERVFYYNLIITYIKTNVSVSSSDEFLRAVFLYKNFEGANTLRDYIREIGVEINLCFQQVSFSSLLACIMLHYFEIG